MMTSGTTEQLNGSKFDIKLDRINDECDTNDNVQQNKGRGLTRDFNSSSRCNVCLKQFECKCHIQKHTKDKHSTESDICNGKSSTLSPMENNPMKMHVATMKQKRNYSNPTKFTCHVCEESFSQLRNLKTHERREHAESCYPVKCGDCSRRFDNETVLAAHISRCHFFKCELCGKCSKTLEDLERHLLLHSGGRPYTCNVCPATFKRNTHLKGHLKIHSNNRPFQCTECSAAFVRKTHLTRHALGAHSNERPFACDVCVSKFKTSDGLSRHMLTHMENRRYYGCDICSIKYKKYVSLKRHMHRFHVEKRIMTSQLTQKKKELLR